MSDEINPQDIPQSQNSNPIELNSLNNTFTYFYTDALANDVPIDRLKAYIKYPMRHNMGLRQISRQAYGSSGMYGNVIDYMKAIPSLDYITVCDKSNAQNEKKRLLFNQIIKKINHKLTTRDIMMTSYIDGMYVGIVRDTKANNKNVQLQQGFVDTLDRLEGLSLDDNLMIQPLDLDYCKFVGFQNNVNIVAFNMMYFQQFNHGGLLNEIKNFPPEFLTAYIAYKKDSSKQWFILNPKTTIALKFKAGIREPYGRPLGLSALFDIRFAEDYYDSQIATVQDLASSIYYLTLPEGDVKGACSLTKPQQEAMIDAFKGAVSLNTNNNKGAKVSKLSLAPGTQIARMPKDSALLKDTLSDENIKKISTSLGFASAALNASGDGGASYSTLAVNINLILCQIFELVEQIAFEYTRVLNNLIGNESNDLIRLKYLKTSILNQTEDFERALGLYTNCGGDITYAIATAGYDVDDYVAIKRMEVENGYKDLFAPNQTSFTMSGKDSTNTGGRPTDNTTLNDSAQKTKANGGNKVPKPSTK